MVKGCCVVGCTANVTKNKGLSFSRIPKLINENNPIYKDKQEELRTLNKKLLERQNAWIRNLKRGPLTQNQIECYRICGKHFINGFQQY